MKIPGYVVLGHALLLLTLIYFKAPVPKYKARTPVAVQTYVVQQEKKPAPAAPAVVAAPKPVAKPQAKPKPVAKPEVKKAPKKPSQEKLIQMMQNSLASMESTPQKEAVQTVVPLASEGITFGATYQEKLVTFLQGTLTLPETGDVHIELTVARGGSVQKVQVKGAASEKNRAYVERETPLLILPPFQHHFKGESAHTFSIVLTST